jgi:2-polyprenyl-3-methyl-5-hydroxy-6-metoxy-1,4-benzoquinol methylase
MSWDPTEYDKQWTAMAAAGKDPHGEVAFLQRMIQRRSLKTDLSFLDAGCGTGRVAIELTERGYRAQGTDVDADMLGEARAKAPGLRWTQGNLAGLTLGESFDVIVLAGNVILFVDPADQPLVAHSLGSHSKPGTLVVAGMQMAREDGRRVALDQLDTWMTDAKFELVERYATWDEDPWTPESDYAVSVHMFLA